jgi:hypothetical protein
MILRLARKYRVWTSGLLAGFIGGGATAGSSWLGITAANALGANIQPLDLKALGWIVLSGGISNALFFLKQSPIPRDEDGTDFVGKPQPVPIAPQKT